MVAQALVVRECAARDLDHFGRFGSLQHVEYCREQFERGRDALAILVAVDGAGEPVGKVHLDFEERAAIGEAVVIAAAVTPDLQGRGIGTELMRAAETEVCERGLGAIVLGVEDSNPRARRLYERLGYEQFAGGYFSYLGAPDPNPGVWMRKKLPC